MEFVMVTEAMPGSSNYQKRDVVKKQPKGIKAPGGNAPVIFADNRYL
jgi:hypothetical protein